MSNIPSTAISSALTPVQQQANELLRARRIQTQKNFHHQEEVDELDDTAVNSVRDEGGKEKGGKDEKEGREEKELVDIEALREVALEKGGGGAAGEAAGGGLGHLDISA